LLDKPATEPGIPGLQKIMASNEIGVIIVDSIAGYFRPFGLPNPNYQERRKVLNRISVHLRQYTEAAIVVLNEVRTIILDDNILIWSICAIHIHIYMVCRCLQLYSRMASMFQL